MIRLFDFYMGVNDLRRLFSDAERAAAKHNYSDAIAKLNKALSLRGISEDDIKKLMAYREDLTNAEFEYRSTENKKRILKALKQFDIIYAKTLYEKANGHELSDDDDTEVYKEIIFTEYIVNAQDAFKEKDLDRAADLANKAVSLYNPPRDDARALFESICQEKKAVEDENKRIGPQLLLPIGTFNIPKKENEGEDADPISMVDSNFNWGFVGVFDGMGGAGAKKYKHIESGEEHTSAYWGSRIVRDCVEELIKNRSLGISPIDWVNEFIHSSIKSKLDEKIKEFPNANGAVLSKMTRKLPTTMAMSGYEIIDDKVAITTYWAGDSRVYILLKDTIKILTIDDANAEDGDPFSPLNMDLAMNNAISQEREFRINRSVITLPISQQEPFLLIASTDGCFGYYKNPIEFEAMLRNCLGKANDCNEYLYNIKEAIIENIQQDDFSISIAGFGSTSFDDYKSVLSSDADVELIDDYYRWRKDIEKQRSDFKTQISDLETKLKEYREEEERLHSIEEQKNLEWYAKYKETFSVVNREEIESI